MKEYSELKYENGDILSVKVDMFSDKISFFKNALTLKVKLSNGDAVCHISTPFTEDDYQELIEELKNLIRY